MDRTGAYFLHTPKIAGTTFRWLVEGQYPAHTCAYAYANIGQAEPYPTIKAETAARIRCFSSNAPMGTYPILEQRLMVITLLREPIDRTVSLYYYRKQRRAHTNDPIQRITMAEYIDRLAEQNQDNMQVRMISGQGFLGSISADVLEQAKVNLREKIAAFGITKQFRESLIVLSRLFGWPRLAYITRNVGRNRHLHTLDQRTLDSIAETNRYDVALYDYACRLFAQRIAQAPITAQELESVREAQGFDRVWGYQKRMIRKLLRIRISKTFTEVPRPSQEEQLYA